MLSSTPRRCSRTSAGPWTAGGRSPRRRDRAGVRLPARPDWRELAATTAAARAYVGPDTAITHLAAATGTPTVALYGPTDPRIWGPWPVGGLDRPWAAAGTIQQ